ncbi:hypothetical protein [Desulfosudis oleivorans]|uniref:Uncharacterized protein n=1 Tax=Desulfosudis oleivorans (strain DSM 6200 / JCM 39069 / Hxd3) TaxID=96561 RepID=A8ZST8_DESOH|nr:hypothetical protein [Desulfosudis oleivorans]ABW66001.1 hypothetical protein Dole_0191 [Desulfosudis oleivorans Hxd3]
MIVSILGAVGYSVLITAIYAVAANICYFLFHGENMFANLHGYVWVEYVISAGIIFGAVFFFELTRRLLADGVRAVGYGVVAAFLYLAIAANVVHYFFFTEMMFRSVAHWAIVIGLLVVTVVVVEGVRAVSGKSNG